LDTCQNHNLGALHWREIQSRLGAAREVVVFTGAGMSSESGIPTFRDGATGLWNNVDPDKVASIQGFDDDPDCVWEWHTQLKKLVDRCAPNSGHRLIASLETRLAGKCLTVITQNIDGYHGQAGNTRVYELHGSIHRLRCHRNCGFFESWEQPGVHRATCPSCGAPVRPDVTWFGEGLNEELLDRAEAAASNADVFIAIGTSGSVYPAAALPLIAKMSGACVIEVNPYDTQLSEHADYVVRSNSTYFLTELIERI
jgi:NAD-dependent deacetylase